MPTISNTALTLTTVNNDVTVRVQYDATFTEFERYLASNGLKFRENISVIGDDAGTVADQTLHAFPIPFAGIPVTAGAGSLTVSRDRSMTVSRASLQEDTNDDEIICNIEITPVGLPATVSGSTPQQTLLG